MTRKNAKVQLYLETLKNRVSIIHFLLSKKEVTNSNTNPNL